MKVERMVPEIYYDKSRDFAYIGRLLEIVFNYMKTAADNVGVEPDEDIDSNIIDLLVNTLGFEQRHNYPIRDLVYIASNFIEMVRNKGSIYAIRLAVKTLLNSQGIYSSLVEDLEQFYQYDQEKKELEIRLPSEMTDVILLDDLMDYILPAGVIYKYTRIGAVLDKQTDTIIVHSDQQNTLTANTSSIRTSRIGEDEHLGMIDTGTTVDYQSNNENQGN